MSRIIEHNKIALLKFVETNIEKAYGQIALIGYIKDLQTHGCFLTFGNVIDLINKTIGRTLKYDHERIFYY